LIGYTVNPASAAATTSRFLSVSIATGLSSTLPPCSAINASIALNLVAPVSILARATTAPSSSTSVHRPIDVFKQAPATPDTPPIHQGIPENSQPTREHGRNATIDHVTALSRLAAVDTSRGAATALVHAGRSWEYRDLRAAANTLAEAIRADDLLGERVALMLPNGAELVICYLACFASGAVAAPLNARYAPPEVELALRRARPRWLIAHANRLATLEAIDGSVLAGVRVIVVGEPDSAPPHGGKCTALSELLDGDVGTKSAQSVDIAPNAPAVIFFTSGSTGRPKGVVHSHASALAMLTSTSEALGDVQPEDVVQVFEPLVHVSGFIATFTTLLSGGTVVPPTPMRGR
jgi:acyl-CoA synthetase (AMP-forming)/AMP-acid ligase II